MYRRSLTWGLAVLLVLGFAVTGTAQSKRGRKAAAPKPTQGLRYASLTPDGLRVVFCYRGDIWIAPVDGKGAARRLTLHEAQDTLPRVSPDGKTIAFSSARNGNYDIYTLPIEGGVPERVTIHSGYEIVCDWSPDGKKLLFVSPREIGAWGADLYEVDVEGGTPRRITFDGGREGTYSPDGKQIVYSRGFNSIYWDDYEGSANLDLQVIDVAGGLPRALTDTPGNERWPCFSKDGSTIYFVAEEKGVANFYAMPAAGGERRQVTKYSGDDVHRPDLSWDWKTAVFELAGRLYTADLESPADKPAPIPITIESDVRNSGIETRTITGGGEQVNISQDGRMAALVVRGDIWIMPASGGQGRRVTHGPATDQWPRFSPDGRSLAYFSNSRGNNDIYILDLPTGASRPVTTHPADDHFQSWSPDGKKLVFTSERSGNKDIWVVELETGVKTQLTRNPEGDDDPVFSPDGRRIAFDSARGGSQAVYVMDADGGNQRRITQEAGFFQVPAFSPDGEMLVYESYSPTTGRSAGLFVVRTNGGPSEQISRDGSAACWSTNGYIYFSAQRGPHDAIFRVKAPTDVEVGEQVPFFGSVQVDVRKELGDLFDEAWTALRDGFYDPKMHGVDWNAMKKKYRDMAIDSEIKSEFQNVIRQMLAELDASHLGITGGSQTGNSVTPPQEENGMLGVSFDHEPTEDGGRRVADVVSRGPADLAGLRVGDVVTRIGRVRLTKDTNLDTATAGIVGKDTPVTFRPQSRDGLGTERTTTIKATSLMGLYELQQRTWVETCARRVSEATKGKKGEVGYIHLDRMDPANLNKFQQAVANWNGSKRTRGMILDVRNNGGGNIHNQLMSILFAKPLAVIQRRGGPKMVQPSLYWDRPIVLLINERSFSDAEVFPHMYKAAGIGKVIGVPTAGGVIGTNDITLSDGSTFRVPRLGFWTMDGTDLEGMGVKPDILVEETADDRLNGRDPQLAKAIEVIMAEIEARDAAAKPAPEPKTEPKTEPKPEPKPEPEPEPEPVPAPAPTRTEDLDPLADVAPGEWVRYRALSPETGEPVMVKVMVTGISDGVVKLANEVEGGKPLDLGLPEALPMGSIMKLLPEFATLKSHVFVDGTLRDEPARLLLATVLWADGSTLQLTFCDKLPAYGLLRVEAGKQVLLEAIDWGRPAVTGGPAPQVDPVPAPVPAPEPERTPAPEEEPAKAEAPPNPIFDAEVGEWTTMKQVAPNGMEVRMTATVIEVTDDEVVVEVVASVPGREMPAQERRRERKKTMTIRDGFELIGYSEATLTVADEELECIVVTAKDPEGVEWKSYSSYSVPVDGLVRVERDGVVVIEIVEWGFPSES